MNNVVEYTKDDVGFYPTPPDVAEKMLSQINWKTHTYKSILEPSAGKGNLVDALLRKAYSQYRGRYGNTGMKIDCLEIDPYLRGIIEHEFCGAKLNEIKNRLRTLEDTRHDARDEKTNREFAQLQEEKDILSCSDVHIVADDFLSYRTYKHYDAIIMNPPFANGDEHLIHAIEMQKLGGDVVCLLNAETIKNPYTKTRKLLKKYLEKYSAEVQFIDGAFVHAERATDVEIALITVVVPRKEEKSYIFEELKKAQERKHETRESTEVTSGDYLERIVEQFNFEVEGTLRLIREYEAVKPYMLTSFEEGCKDAILTLSLAKDERNYEQLVSVNKYLSIVRLKYWRALFRNKEFTGALTKNLYEKYHNIVESMGDYDFTMYNIRRFQQQIMSELSSGVNDTILALFEKLSEQHSWYPECGNNIHYFDGWATNKAHMINNKKVIIPTWGVFSDCSWSKNEFNQSVAFDALSDIEKVLNYLNTGTTAGPDMWDQLQVYGQSGTTKKIPLKYFFVTFYKKGTCHIEWRQPELIDKLNIYGCQRKNWLPPTYGKKHYTDMTPEEKTVIDEFQGEQEYEKVVSNADFYLASSNQMMLIAGKEDHQNDM